MNLKAIILITFLIFLAGCGGSEDSSPGKKIVPLSPELMENILDQQSFTCRFSESDCPYGIGRLFILNTADLNTSSVCTGFLVESNRLVTNHHCVSSEEECRNTYVSIRTRNGPMKAHCERLVFTRSDSDLPNNRTTDLSVITLDTDIPGPYFRISGSRPEMGETVTSWVVDHVNATDAIVTKLTCLYESRERSMMLRKCPAISGNSGSPVLSGPSGEVVGILWGSNLPSSVDAAFPYEMRISLPSISVATELFPYRDVINGEDSSLR